MRRGRPMSPLGSTPDAEGIDFRWSAVVAAVTFGDLVLLRNSQTIPLRMVLTVGRASRLHTP
jgi:hypothetical protein